MEEHLLLAKAHLYESPKKNCDIDNAVYDALKGFWVYNESKFPCVMDEKFAGPRTKKDDIETGEDQKGE
jgi:hypothetical protein